MYDGWGGGVGCWCFWIAGAVNIHCARTPITQVPQPATATDLFFQFAVTDFLFPSKLLPRRNSIR